jgi:MoaA/NifB/PqqE/SkfB family radical SAM enzyme
MPEVTKRYWIHVGNSCNLRCRFCYYIDSLDPSQDKTTEQIKEQLRYLKKYGKNRVDFTGGEPTIRKDLPEIILYAKKIGFKQIGIITNGLLLANKEIAKKLVKAGLNDTLFSLHGHTPEIHDYYTQVKGSFEKLIQGARNIKDLGVQVRTNTTILKSNYKDLPELANVFIKMKADICNFIMFNPAEDAAKNAKKYTPNYTKASEYIKKTIDILKPHVKKINVRYIPFCSMKCYEQYVCNHYQQIYDQYEADQIIRERERVSTPITIYHILRGLIKTHPKIILSKKPYAILLHLWVKNLERKNIKNNECKKCMARHICEGVSKKYVDLFGESEIKAIKGKPVYDSLYFKKQ